MSNYKEEKQELMSNYKWVSDKVFYKNGLERSIPSIQVRSKGFMIYF